LHADLFSTGKAAMDLTQSFGKFAALYKYSRQDNTKPPRSAMGESNGLSYAQRPEDHATGMAAMQSLDRFRKKQSYDMTLADTFVDTCMARGMNLDQIAQALIKTSGAVNPQLLGQLLSGLEKFAGSSDPLADALNPDPLRPQLPPSLPTSPRNQPPQPPAAPPQFPKLPAWEAVQTGVGGFLDRFKP